MSTAHDERAGIAILRAWVEGSEAKALRVRITKVVDGRQLPPTTVTSVDAVVAIVEAWLDELLDGPPSSPMADTDL